MKRSPPNETDPHDVALLGTWPGFEAIFDYADPHGPQSVSFRVCVPCNEATGDVLKVTVSTHYPDLLANQDGIECESPVEDVPQDILDAWTASALGQPTYPTRAIKQSNLVPLQTRQIAFCDICPCDPE